jgi:hypothetical protein
MIDVDLLEEKSSWNNLEKLLKEMTLWIYKPLKIHSNSIFGPKKSKIKKIIIIIENFEILKGSISSLSTLHS